MWDRLKTYFNGVSTGTFSFDKLGDVSKEYRSKSAGIDEYLREGNKVKR